MSCIEREARYIDINKVTIPTGFFNQDLNVPKLLDWLNSQPTADVAEVKHGEWVKHHPDPETMRKWHELGIGKGMSENSIFWTCSCCGCWGTPRQKFCSDCGAKMDGKENGDA